MLRRLREVRGSDAKIHFHAAERHTGVGGQASLCYERGVDDQVCVLACTKQSGVALQVVHELWIVEVVRVHGTPCSGHGSACIITKHRPHPTVCIHLGSPSGQRPCILSGSKSEWHCENAGHLDAKASGRQGCVSRELLEDSSSSAGGSKVTDSEEIRSQASLSVEAVRSATDAHQISRSSV